MNLVRLNGAAVAKVQSLAAEETRKIAHAILADAQRAAPVRTGALRDSGFVEDEGDGEFTIGFFAEYARFVEFGTRNQPAQPFLTPAAFKRRR